MKGTISMEKMKCSC